MHDRPTMTLEEFDEHLDRAGASIDAWPSTVALDARKLLAESADARAHLKQASALERLLDESMAVTPLTTGALRSRILDAVAVAAARPRLWSWFVDGIGIRGVAVAAALVPLCLGIGFALGVGVEPRTVSDEFVTDVSLLAFADYEGYADAN